MPRHPDAIYHPFHPVGSEHPFSLFVEQGWALRIQCWDCEHQTHIAPAELVEHFGEGCSVAELHPRLVCRCGSKQVMAAAGADGAHLPAA